jgi:hypothetical protein
MCIGNGIVVFVLAVPIISALLYDVLSRMDVARNSVGDILYGIKRKRIMSAHYAEVMKLRLRDD